MSAQPAERSPAEQKRGRGRPRDPRTDAKITAAAAELMVERGFDKMTVDDVADRAGVGKATVYRRWPSKSDLAVAAISEILLTEFPEPDTGSIVTDLREGLLNAVAFANTEGGIAFMKMCITESLRDPRIAALYRESSDRREEQSKESFRKAIARGEVRPDARIDYALSWIGGVMASRIISDRPMPTRDEVEDMLQFILRGVLA
ncbi:MAG TPA: TetR/AcrR family transcriptional regulator [Nocardioidaceae bacterium]|nr:TetR/AcrR family transcriptional regulator [Nocardioidaceae bacterium]